METPIVTVVTPPAPLIGVVSSTVDRVSVATSGQGPAGAPEVVLTSPVFTWDAGKLVSIDYAGGYRKEFTYGPTGLLLQIRLFRPGKPTSLKTLVWSSGVLQRIDQGEE